MDSSSPNHNDDDDITEFPLVELNDEGRTTTSSSSNTTRRSRVSHDGTTGVNSRSEGPQLPPIDTSVGSSSIRGPATAPVSSNKRNRGYSLRTQMFAKLSQKESESRTAGETSPIEMTSNIQPVSPRGSLVESTSPPPPPPPTGPPPAFGPYNTGTRSGGKQTDANIVSSDIQEEPLFSYEESGKKNSKSEDSRARTAELLPNYSSWAQRNMSKATKVQNQVKESLQKVKDFLLRVQHIPPSKDGRKIPIEVPLNRPALIDERTSRPYCSNLITSSIYTPYTFLPKQLVAQFSKLANIYFMAVSILQMIPSWSTTGNYTTIIPLMVFITISMGREGFDDWRRHRQDKVENNRTCKIAELNVDYQNRRLDDGDDLEMDDDSTTESPLHYKEIAWKDLKVGDIVRLKQNEWVPADIILLHSSGEQNLSYIETMALDGETNLKTKEPHPDMAKLCDTKQKLASLKADVVTEDPNLDLYNFEAQLTINGKTNPLDSSHVVYRGSVLRNTPSVHGLVIFTGEESKIRMNAVQVARTKAPRLQKKANNIVLFLVAFVLGLSVFSLVAGKVYYSTTGKNMWYLVGLEVGTMPNLMGFIIMYNTLIPLSLYVSMEIVKVVQMLMLQLDIDMYHAESNTPLEAKTATINEELGQVSYIFSDKTGTLTDNVMLFRKFTVAGHAWLHDLDIQMADAEENEKLFHKVNSSSANVDKGKQPLYSPQSHTNTQNVRRVGSTGAISTSRKQSTDYYNQQHSSPRPSVDDIFRQVAALPRKSSSIHRPSTSRPKPRKSTASAMTGPRGRPSVSSSNWRSTAVPGKVQSTFTTLQLLQYLQSNPHTVYSKRARFFLLGLALCHSCLPETTGDGEIENLEYQAASPDELALVEAARDLGYIVVDRQHQSITVRTYPHGFDNDPVDEVYSVLETIEFSSSRKRMSILIKFPDGRICVFCKGADNIIMERLKNSKLAQAKADEINQQSSERKAAEAELVVARNSISSAANQRISSSQAVAAATQQSRISISGVGRPSLNLGGSRRSINIDRKQALSSLDQHFQRAKQDDGVEQIAESSRRSMTAARQKRYGDNASGARTSRDYSRTSRDHSGGGAAVRFSTDNNNYSPQEDWDYDGEEYIEIDEKLVMNDNYVMERTLEHIEEFSTEGLRTLMYGYRWMDKEEYDNWAKLYRDARTSLVDRQEKIEKVGESVERDFELLGATAIEDKLQEGVPEAIDKLRRANIRLWMLTGDKRETAINIGYSCRLIKDYSTVVVLRSDEGDVAGKMAAAMLSLDGGNVAHCVVVVDGLTLSQIEQDMTLMTLFIDLGVKADSVICCRASPAQKSAMVTAVRKKVSSAVCLAIGDGANDIAMIRCADVGIGITGKEGLQAARSSDYSIAQFRFLLKLLLVHGRWNYVRICKYILGTFYKEFMFYLTQAIYQRNTMFTGTSMYENWSLSMFNTLFTSLPVLCVGIMERDLSPTTLIAVPELYAKGQKNQGFGLLIFLGWMVIAASESVIVSFLSYYLYGFYAITDNTMYPLGTLSFTVCLILICTKLQLVEMYTITVISIATMVISIGGWFCWDMFLSYVYSTMPSKIYFVEDGLFARFGRDLSWWSALLVTGAIGIIFDLMIQMVRVQVTPTETEVFQELEHDPAVWKRLEEEAEYELAASNEGARMSKLKRIAKKRGITLEEAEAIVADEVAPGTVTPYHDETRSPEPEAQERDEDVENHATSRFSRGLQPQRSILGNERKRDKIKKKLRFAPRKTSGEYEREIEEILERREMQTQG